MDKETMISLTADIVSAHVSNNPLDATDVPDLIRSVFMALSNAVNPTPSVVEEIMPQPAVSIRASVKPDALTCLECGAKFKMLKRHLSAEHDMTAKDYKARWNLGSDYPLVAPNYATQRSELAQTIGLGRKTKVAKTAEPEIKSQRVPGSDLTLGQTTTS